MKETLLAVAAATMIASTAMAETARPTANVNAVKKEALRHNTGKKMRDIKMDKSRLAAPSRAEQGTLTMDWGFCDEPYNAFQFDLFTVNQAICVSAEDATTLAGASLNSIMVGTPANPLLFDEATWEYGNDIEDVTVWLAYDLEGEHFAEAKGKFDPIGFTWSSVDLAAPYIIESGKAFYVGVTYDLNVKEEGGEKYSDDFGYVTDYGYPEYPNTCLTYTALSGTDDEGEFIFEGEPRWQDIGDYIGNANIRISLTGDNLPTNIAYISECAVPGYVAPGEPLQLLLSVKNMGADMLESVDVCLEYADGTKQTVSSPVCLYDMDWNLVPYAISYNNYGIVEANFDGPAGEGYTKYTVTIPGLNGSAANKADTSYEGMVLSLSSGYHKNNVVEEATGTWCGYCVVGYAGMQWLAANCEENAIGIALHSGDPMAVLDEGNAYEQFGYGIDGYPSAFFNRNWKNDVYPSPEDFEEQMYMVEDVPAMAEIKATITPVSEDGRTVRLDTKSTFALSSDGGDFGIAYTVVEDGVGPYVQTNYLSGGAPGSAYGFEDKPDHVRLMFDDVARNCSHPLAIENSLPDAIVKGDEYEFSTTIELTDVKNLNNYRIVPMIINNTNGYVENACVAKSPTYDYSAVKSIEADKTQQMSVRGGRGVITISGDTDSARIYSVDGRFIGNAKGYSTPVAPGFYIVVRGNQSSKVIVR